MVIRAVVIRAVVIRAVLSPQELVPLLQLLVLPVLPVSGNFSASMSQQQHHQSHSSTRGAVRWAAVRESQSHNTAHIGTQHYVY